MDDGSWTISCKKCNHKEDGLATYCSSCGHKLAPVSIRALPAERNPYNTIEEDAVKCFTSFIKRRS